MYNNSSNASSARGPVRAAAAKAGDALTPLAEDLRARLPAAGPALDVAAASLSRAVDVSDAAYHARVAPPLAAASRELDSPEARRLRLAAVAFFEALVSVLALYSLRFLAVTERALGIIHPSDHLHQQQHPPQPQLRSPLGHPPLQGSGNTSAPPSAGENTPVTIRLRRVATEATRQGAMRARDVASRTQAGAALSKVFICALAVVARAARRAAGYTGDYREYVVPVASWIASQCDVCEVRHAGPTTASSLSSTTSTPSVPSESPSASAPTSSQPGPNPTAVSSDASRIIESSHGKSD